MRIQIIGRTPPPVGGVSIHTDRLVRWLADIDGVEVRSYDVRPVALFRLIFETIFVCKNSTLIHCQTSTAWGLVIVALGLWISASKSRLVYSIHSEYWVDRYLKAGSFRSWLVKLSLRRLDLLVADSPRIARDAQPYFKRIEILSPFLPPKGEVGETPLATYLGLEAFDAPVLVFNAYKLSYLEDGRDVYGFDVLMKAYLKLNVPLTLLILVPQLTGKQGDGIRSVVATSTNSLNRHRVHIVSDPKIKGWKAIAKADLFVRPTITDGDSLSVREALFFGVPTIASDCSIRPEGTVLFQTGNSDDLCEKITLTVGQRKVAPQFSVKNNPAMVFLAVYRSLF